MTGTLRAHFPPLRTPDVALSAADYGAPGRMVIAFSIDSEERLVLRVERDRQRGESG